MIKKHFDSKYLEIYSGVLYIYIYIYIYIHSNHIVKATLFINFNKGSTKGILHMYTNY